jgi:hypothetical protein
MIVYSPFAGLLLAAKTDLCADETTASVKTAGQAFIAMSAPITEPATP